MITAYNGTFLKKDGEHREMLFAHLGDLPEAAFDQIVGAGPARTLPSGMELVFDLQVHDLRVFNHNTLQGNLTPYEIEVEDYWDESVTA
jgi:hypothetical protein